MASIRSSARTIRELIREEAARGAAVVLTTHDMHEADRLSDRVAFINQGSILAIDAPEALKLQHGRAFGDGFGRGVQARCQRAGGSARRGRGRRTRCSKPSPRSIS